ncbi:MAG: type VI secretion system ATPase TssH [Sandaracinus sp.]
MRSDPRKLVRRLTPRARRHLESAVTAAALAQHAELAPEHVLRELLADESGDASCVLAPETRAAALAGVEAWLARLPRGGARPSLGDSLVRWLERAWLVASLELGETATRSYALLLAHLELAARTPGAIAALDSISLDEVREKKDSLAASAESRELGAPAPAGASAPVDGSALSRFTTSFTERARRGELDPVLGRERETRQLVDILARRRKNNPVLVGEPGVGKTAVVEGLALAIVRGEVPEALREVDLRALDLGLLEAGAGARGEMEQRLTSLLREVKESPRPIVLFLDEAHTLVGAQPSGGTDAANLLKPALARGELRTIAATTFREHKKYFEKDAALERRFQKVTVEEPDEARAVTMLRGLVPTYEAAHGVLVRDEAVLAAVRLGKRYLAGRQLPDSCVDVLDTTAARVRTSQAAPPPPIVERRSEIAGLERELAALGRERVERPEAAARVAELEKRITAERGLLAELEARWKRQRDALERFLGARRALAALPPASAPADRRAAEIEVRVAREAYEASVDGEPWALAEVDARAVAATVEAWTGIPVGDVERRQNELLRELEAHLDRRVIGQGGATRRLAEGLRIAQAGLRRVDAPRGVFLLVGPSGVGKTETAHAIADLLHGGDRFLTTINLSEHQEKHTISRLVGSPPGYVGYGEGGKLTEAVRLRPHSVVLLDECEKADLEVMNVFYQLLDRGVLADGEGRLVDFRSATLVLTSNLGADRIAELAATGTRDLDAIERAVRPLLAAHFAPALLARMTVIPYLPLDEEALGRIVDLELARIAERARTAHGLTLRFAPELHAMLLASARDPSAGVRHLRARIEVELLAPLASELLAPARAGVVARSLAIGLDDARRPTFTWSAR